MLSEITLSRQPENIPADVFMMGKEHKIKAQDAGQTAKVRTGLRPDLKTDQSRRPFLHFRRLPCVLLPFLERLPARVTGLNLVPPFDLVALAQFPAEQDNAPVA